MPRLAIPLYNAANWYWVTAENPGQVWSSARAQYVPTTDPAYQAWLAAGNITTRQGNPIPEAELQAVLAKQYPAGWPGGDLATVLGNGLQIVSTSTPALNGIYDISPTAQQKITALAAAIANPSVGIPGGGSTFAYLDLNGNSHSFTGAQFTAFAQAVMNFVYAAEIAAATATAAKTPATYPTQPITIP
jgi:hypothetical protein